MYQIRNGVFETNSSSTHSLCICTEEDFEKFKRNEVLWDKNVDELVPNDIFPKYINRAKEYYQSQQDSYMKDWDELSEEDQLNFVIREFDESESGDWILRNKVLYSNWGDNLEAFSERFTSPSGDKMVVFGEYGYGD